MKFPLYLLAALALSACAGPEGNPNGQPYAGEPGGMIAVKPEPAPAVAYDPQTVPPVFDDLLIAKPVPAPLPPPAPPYRVPAR